MRSMPRYAIASMLAAALTAPIARAQPPRAGVDSSDGEVRAALDAKLVEARRALLGEA